MSVYTTILVVLITELIINNIIQYLGMKKEIKALKAKGQDPLVFRNTLVRLVAVFTEAATIVLLVFFSSIVFSQYSVINVIILVVFVYFSKSIVSYLTAWVTWDLFVRKDIRKQTKEVKEQMNNG